MRKIFINQLVKAATKNKKIVLIVGDLGYGIVEPFKEKFPKRFFNAGVSEQSMAGIAAGLALKGFHVFIYSIANFPTFRCAEQIRNDVDYHNFPVTIVAVGAGVSYGHLGYSHHALQDYGLMRLFPNMLILSPGNNDELLSSLDYLIKNPQPSYLRLDKVSNDKAIYKNFKNIFPGKLNELKINDPKKAIITTGNTQDIAMKILNKDYPSYSLLSMPMWGMKFKNKARQYFKKYSKIITIEDHLEDGGFGSWVKECININDKIKINSKFISSNVVSKVGNKKFLLEKYGPK